jgi:hypothetical protein
MIISKVLVRLPDGSFQRLPLARGEDDGEGGFIKPHVIRHDTEKAARGWSMFVLPGRVEFVEEED